MFILLANNQSVAGEYTNDVVYIGTKDNQVANALQRIEINNLMF